ncbi:YCF48-related protein [Halopseudomonas pachastrellae]|nr:YCF48-related protein [Halopseudomonas pachastrellae]
MQYRDPELDQPVDPDGPSLLERPLMDVWFRDANTGFAIGAYGTFLRTDDGGETWEDRTYDIDNPDGFHYNAMAEVNGAGLFIAGEMARCTAQLISATPGKPSPICPMTAPGSVYPVLRKTAWYWFGACAAISSVLLTLATAGSR